MIELRDYQLRLVDDIREAYRTGKNAPLVVLPTGGGKTTIFAYITHGAASKGNTVFLLAHRSELIHQISQTLGRFDVCHNIIAPHSIIRQAKVNHFHEFSRSYVDYRASVYVASVQTIVRRLGQINAAPSLIVIDEAHHLTLKSSWGKVISAYPDAKLLPVTATPCRLDGKGLGIKSGGFADAIVSGPTMRQLIDAGYLSEYRIFAPPNAIDLSSVRTKMGDYDQDEVAAQVDKPTITGDAVKHYRQHISGKRAIVFCVNIKHAQHVAASFQAAGIASEPLDGSMDSGLREAAIQRFRDGHTLVLTSCQIVSEGFDLPAIEAAILLRPTQSLSMYLQQVGRALRVMDGKECAYIFDHVGNAMRHGLPDDDRQWSLDGAKRKGRKNEVAPLPIQRCPVCFAIHKPAPICSNCGHKYAAGAVRREIKQVEGTLVEISPAERKAAQVVRKREEWQCKTLEDFIELGKARNYSYPHAWAKKRFAFRQKKTVDNV